MPTYEYECKMCGLRFEQEQAMSDAPLEECPKCKGKVTRLVTGGTGFIFKGSGHSRIGHRAGSCSLEQSGKTCCGRAERCSKSPCGT